jgi:hypothetical protein
LSSCISFSLPAFDAASHACMPVACGVGRGVREDAERNDFFGHVLIAVRRPA